MIPFSDAISTRTFPYVNVAIIIANLLLFIYEVALSQQAISLRETELDRLIQEWGNIPACTFDAFGIDTSLSTLRDLKLCDEQPEPRLTIFSAMFLHASWLHVAGNLLFLWVFGDNIEDALGHVRYLLFYLVGGVAAALTHGLIDIDSTTPAIGASGAISAVMGAYLVLYPRALVSVFAGFFFLVVPLPAFAVIGLWFVLQVFSGFASLGVDAAVGGGVAYFAHIGGFVAGVALILPLMVGRERRPVPARQRWG